MHRHIRFFGYCLASALTNLACSSDQPSSGKPSTSGGSAGAGAEGGVGAGTSSGGTSGGSKPSPIASAGMGGPGCGLPAAAFCDTFDAPTSKPGRAGDLDPSRWSASHGEPQLPTGNNVVFGVGPATLPTCRAGLPAQVFPNSDALICDPTAAIATSHLLVAVGAQNYGQNSYRIRQPFDFAGRTGTIVFDAEPFIINPLLGWISLEVTEDPTPIPSYSIGADKQTNDEGGAVPKNALEIQFSNQCAGSATPEFAVGLIDVLSNYKDAVSTPSSAVCVAAQQGHLNHFEVKVSQQKVEVYASPFSADGKTFAATQLLYSADVSLPFSHGYVQITTHNHATVKYSGLMNGMPKGNGADTPIDAWIARWDNVGFDGPVYGAWREYEIPDSLVPGQNSWDIMGPVMSVGYLVADAMAGPNATLHFPGVDVTDVQSAQLAVAAWYNIGGGTLADFDLQYRLNKGAWHDRKLNADEIAVLSNGHAQGAIGQVMDVPVAELLAGDNTLELQAVNIPQNYPPAVSSIDLVLSTK